MEFDLHSNNLLDWSFIGDSLIFSDFSKPLSDADALAPFPETIDHPYDHNSLNLYSFATPMASDLIYDNIIPWNENLVTFTSNHEIVEPVPLTSIVSGELEAAYGKGTIPPPNGFIPNWNINSVMLPNKVPPFPALASNMATKMDYRESSKENILPDQYSTTEDDNKMEELTVVTTERRETGKSRLANISHAEIKKYFCIPITRAAKELNVGLTILKKRCRELGIPRWPHRKIKSLKSLISNVQELGKESALESVRKELEMLENHKKLMEDNPEMQLTERTKKLRQACFKANYKKRRARVSHHYHC